MKTLLLIVDDEPDILKMTELFLSASGYEIITATGGEAALAAFESAPRHPDLVLADVVMPGMSGPMLIDRLRAIEPAIRVLFMSGYDERHVVQRYVVKQGYSLITKPFTHKGLQAAVQAALAAFGADPVTSGEPAS